MNEVMTKEHKKDINIENEIITKKYIIIDENMVYNGIKYEIGKTYRILSIHNRKFFPKIIDDYERLDSNVRKHFFTKIENLLK